MTFNPQSNICLCNVPIDNTYKNQIYFSSLSDQTRYFRERVVKTFTNYLTVRKTLPDGSLQSSVKVEANIDDLYNCNYMYYQNLNHGNRIFYAFITKLIYINEGTTEVVFETDVYQTWLFDVELKESFVVREHSVTDEIGDNIVPEKINIQDYEYIDAGANILPNLRQWGYLIASSEDYRSEGYDGNDYSVSGTKHSGIYQGLKFYYYTNYLDVNEYLKGLQEKGLDPATTIVSITLIPEFCVSHAKIGSTETEQEDGIGFVAGTDYPNEQTIQLYQNTSAYGGWTPNNNKLRVAPYANLVITNNSGEKAVYNYEDFVNPKKIQFKMYGDISTTPSVALIPLNYKSVEEYVDEGITLPAFPQCSFNNDAYKLWVAKNQGHNTMKVISSTASLVGGAALMITGVGAIAGAGLLTGGATGLGNYIADVFKSQKMSNDMTVGNPQNNLLTAMGKNKFEIYHRRIKYEHAKTVDAYFTMYGYQTNALKVPNVSSRPYFNYVQTADCNIVGAIPDDDMRRLKDMYNAGVTLWKHTATVGDYSVNNSPS